MKRGKVVPRGACCVTEIDGIGAVESWDELTNVNGSLVSFRSTTVFASNGEVVTSDSSCAFANATKFRRTSSRTATS